MTRVSIPTREETIRAHRARGGTIAAVYPIHYPRALFRAYGMLPVEVWGPPHVDPSEGYAHLQRYVCSVVRNGLAFAIGGGLDQVDAVLVPHGCDSLQGLGSLLSDFVDTGKPVMTCYLPRSGGGHDAAFVEDELARLGARLADLTGRVPSTDDLLEAIAAEEAADERIAALFSARRELAMDNSSFYRLVRAREYLPAEELVRLADAALANRQADAARGIPLLLSGVLPEPMALFEAFDDMGALVVADDTMVVGRRIRPSRAALPTALAGSPPLGIMAHRLLAGPPDSTRGSSIDARIAHLGALVRGAGVKGVVFYEAKFCEPELFYLPRVREALDAMGCPSVVVEADIGDPLSPRIVNRLEAFGEMIL